MMIVSVPRKKERDNAAKLKASPGSMIFLSATALAIGLTVGIYLQWDPTPTSLTQSRSANDSVQVASSSFDDAREIDLAITAGLPLSVRTGVAGVLTTSACRPAAKVSSGDLVARLGRARVVALATGTPLWRDLRRGSTGDDVVGLNRALARLGLRDKASLNVVTAATIDAAIKLAGLPASTSSIPVGTFAWMPDVNGIWASCTAGVGDRLEPGAEVGQLSPAPQRISLKATPADPISGGRELVIGNAVVGLRGPGITAKRDLRLIQATQEYRLWEQSGGTVALSGQWRLRTPVMVSSVPASAVIAAGARTCVLATGTPVRVTVVSSSLGRSLVRFEEPPPERVDLVPPDGATCPS